MKGKTKGYNHTVRIPVEEAHLFIKGRFYREKGGYYHICPFTGEGFFGRRNQVYPDQKTKSRAAAALRAERKTPPPEIKEAIMQNEELLKKVYLRGPKKTANLITLTMGGFDSMVQAKDFTNIYGLKIRFYNFYGYYQFPNSMDICIYRKSTDYKHYYHFDGDKHGFTDEQKKMFYRGKKPPFI